MSKSDAINNRFKYYMIGTLSIVVLLIIGIILLSGNRPRPLPNALREANINSVAIDKYGTSVNEEEYIVYIYGPTCYYCQQLMQSSTYQAFIRKPEVKMYKVSTNYNDESIGDYNPDVFDFLNEYRVESTPTMIYIKKVSEGKYLIETVVGQPECEALLKSHTTK